MAADSFAATVAAWVAKTKERTEAVRQEATQRIIEEMQEPGPSRARTSAAIKAGAGLGKVRKNGTRGVSKKTFGPVARIGGGGNLPVDTGFLRASLVVSVGDALPPLVDPPEDGGSDTWDAAEVKLTISGADLSDTITAAYAAKYARRLHYGFSGKDSLGRTYSQAGTMWVSLAAQRWPQIVAQVAKEAQARAGG